MSEKFKILIVDDEKEIRQMLSLEFKMEGWDVAESASAADAIQQMKGNIFDIVLSDIRMPGMSGYEMLKHLRLQEKNCTPVILMTGFAEVTRNEALSAGAIDLLAKPIENMENIVQLAMQNIRSQ